MNVSINVTDDEEVKATPATAPAEATAVNEGQQTKADQTPAETKAEPNAEAEPVDTTPPAEDDPPTPEPTKAEQPVTAAVKMMALDHMVAAVREAVWALEDQLNRGMPDDQVIYIYPVAIYEDFVIVRKGSAEWRVAYTIDEESEVALQPLREWQLVEQEWVLKQLMDTTMIRQGGEVKAIGTEEGDGLVGGYLVSFTDSNNPDLVGDFFDRSTDFGPHRKTLVFFDHGLDPALGTRPLGVKSDGRQAVMGTLKMTDVGVWIEAQLDLRDEYEAAIYQLAQKGKLGWSSGTASHLVKRARVGKAHHLSMWPLGLDASLTATPAAGPALTAAVPLKAWAEAREGGLNLKTLMATAVEEQSEDLDMNLDDLKQVVESAIKPLAEKVDANAQALESMKTAPATNRLPVATEEPQRDNGVTDAAKTAYVMRFGQAEPAMKQILDEVSGGDYNDVAYRQNLAFAKYVRHGADELDREERKLLKRQMFSPTDIKNMIRNGYDMRSIKDTMITTQGTLGGYALPPNVQEEIVSRLPGLTVVRSNGARVVNLVNATGVQITVYAGGDARYRGAIRGAWGGEKATAQETNATFEQVTVEAHPYTFYVPMSRTMLMNAGNVVDLLTNDIVDTAAIDEDEAFLVGEGTGGKPYGIIPGGAWDTNLGIGRVQVSGGAITADAMIELSDDIDDQYIEGAIFVYNKATGTDIRQLKDLNDDYLLQRGLAMGQPRTILEHEYRRSQAMPDVATNATPVLFGNMGGYLIVQEPGLTIERFQDSNTGLGEVQFHVWRMLGGRVEKPWMFSALEINS